LRTSAVFPSTVTRSIAVTPSGSSMRSVVALFLPVHSGVSVRAVMANANSRRAIALNTLIEK